MHSKTDEVINYNEWEKLFNAMIWEKYFLELFWNHNYWYMNNYEQYINTLKDFLKIKS